MSSQSIPAKQSSKHLVLHRETVRNLHAGTRIVDDAAPSDQKCSKQPGGCKTTK